MKPRYLVCIVNHNKKVFVQYTVRVTCFNNNRSVFYFPFAGDFSNGKSHYGDVEDYEVIIHPIIYQDRDECNKMTTKINMHYHDLDYRRENLSECVYKISNKPQKLFTLQHVKENVLTLRLKDVINYDFIHLIFNDQEL